MSVEKPEWHNNPYSHSDPEANLGTGGENAADGSEVDDGKQKQRSLEEQEKRDNEARDRFEAALLRSKELRNTEVMSGTTKQEVPTVGEFNLAFNDFPPKSPESIGAQAEKVEGGNNDNL